MSDTLIKNLVINELTQAQYDQAKEEGELSDTELYIISDKVSDIPEQTGQNGKYLRTNGSEPYWDALNIGNATISFQQGGVIKGTMTTNQSANATIQLDPTAGDEVSITKNSDDELQSIGVINQNATTTALKMWSGTLAQYNAITTKDANTLYNITDDAVPGGGGGSYTAGNGIDITDNVISVTTPTLTNTATGTNSLTVGGTASTDIATTNVGILSQASGGYGSTAIGRSSLASGNKSTALGYNSVAYGYSIAIGAGARMAFSSYPSIAIGSDAIIDSNSKGAIQIGTGTNSEAGSLAIGLTTDGTTFTNYKLLSSDGTIPEGRLKNVILRGTSAPTTSTVATYVGQDYLDIASNDRYYCEIINEVEANGTVSGSVTNKNGIYVASGNWNLLPGISIVSGDTYEFILKYNCLESKQVVFVNATTSGASFYKQSNNKVTLYNGTNYSGATALTNGKWYWLKAVYDGTNTVAYSLEDNNYTLETLPTEGWTTEATISGSSLWAGRTIQIAGNNATERIDLNNTKFTVNTTVWNGTKTKSPVEYVWNKELKNNSTGTCSISICGKGTTASNSTEIGYNASATTNGSAIGYNSSSTGSGSVAIGYYTKSTDSGVAIGSLAKTYGTRSIQFGKGVNTEFGTFNVSLDTSPHPNYDITKNYKLLDQDGSIPSERLSNTVLSGITAPNSSIISGFVGQLYVDTVTKKLYTCTSLSKTGTDKQCTIVGTLTESNHDFTGFSLSNYLQMSNPLNSANYDDSFEMNFAFTLSTIGVSHIVYAHSTAAYKSGLILDIGTSNKMNLYMSTNGSSATFTITGSTALVANTKYYVKVTYDKIAGYKLFSRTDTTDWNLEGSNTNVNKPYYDSTENVKLGCSTSKYLQGTLHLENCSIFLDNVKVFNPYYNYVWEEVAGGSSSGITKVTKTLVAADWNNLSQTITVDGVTADSFVWLSPNASSKTEFNNCGVTGTEQGTDSLTFTCNTVPTNNLTINIAIA